MREAIDGIPQPIGSVDIVRVYVYEVDGTRSMSNPVARRQMRQVFVGVTWAGASIALQSQRRLTGRPYGEKFDLGSRERLTADGDCCGVEFVAFVFYYLFGC